MTYNPRTRERGFAPWSPHRKTAILLSRVREVLKEYDAYLPLTVRQIFYRLVAGGFDKTEPAYKGLCEMLNRARRAGFISWQAIRDDGGTRIVPQAWNSAEHFRNVVAHTVGDLRLDRQDGQPVRLWLLCEAAGMAPMLAEAAGEFGVPVHASGGFDSATSKYDLARAMAQFEATEVLHIGDHDPSGVHLFKALAEDVCAMVEALGGATPIFTRLAVTEQQIDMWALPTAPAKATDRREFKGETVQAEAIPPDLLSELVTDAINSRQDVEIVEAMLDREEQMRMELTSWVERRA